MRSKFSSFKETIFTKSSYILHCLFVTHELLIWDVKRLSLPIVKGLLSHDHLHVCALLAHKVASFKVGDCEQLQEIVTRL